MTRLLVCLLVLAIAGAPTLSGQKKQKLLIAFSSYKDRPKHPNIYFYEHDGVGAGKIVGSVGTVKAMASADAQPSLSHDGRFCAFTHEIENKTSRIFLWDLKEQKLVDLPTINDSPHAQLAPSISHAGDLIAFSAWNRTGGAGPGYHVYLYDRTAKKVVDLPGLNNNAFDDRMSALSGDGRFVAWASNRKGGAGLTDLWLYDRKEAKIVPLEGVNSKATEIEPALNRDGSLIAFSAERPDGVGGRDVYVVDRATGKPLPLPGLNSPSNDTTPSLSPDGRYLAFVSERLAGENDGERDIYLYDRQAQKLLPTPGLNSKTEDFDPCVIVLGD